MTSDGTEVDPRHTVYLVRHGQTALNAERRLRGLLDPPLDPAGHHQVEALAAAFARLPAPPARVVASPLERAHQTATAIALASAAALVTEQRLIDRDFGPWTGQCADEVRASFGADLDPLPGAEPLAAVTARALEALDHADRRGDGPVVLVSHEAVLTALLAALGPTLGQPSAYVLHTASWSQVTADDDEVRWWRVVRIGCNASTLGEEP